ncbi:MAG: hypothetical protein CVV52_00305 [Spirochaetae bacterium HGW-Spirochaetae-8]|nr:MAG: hypothetical protein CVV52_00305 [Spirochaetae bacterium HGW-Spirochaetae-8]
MWIDVKGLSQIIGKTPRTIQLMAKAGKIQSRPLDGKRIEVYIPSLPMEWQTLLVKAGKLSSSSPASLTVLAPPAQLALSNTRSTDLARLGTKVTDKQRERLLVAQRLKARPAGTPRTAWIKSVASFFDISPSTCRRIAAEIEDYGIVGKPRNKGEQRSWDPEAVAYIKGYWLQAIREIGECSKTTAWKAVQIKARNENWKIGSRSSAFNLLGDVDHLMVAYARGGNRALDNYFYITRDCDALQPMQIVIGDQHIFDWWIADYETGTISRPECYLWLDMCTKLIYGIAFDKTYSSDTVKEALRLGLYRFGAFDCTYNDNGSSECSKAINSIIDDLINLQMAAADVSDLYKTPEGIYVVVNEEGDVLESARTPDEWRRKHRRIFANVKNAKAKDIERFFRTLEGRIESRMLPGRCATPGATAAIDEVERARLEAQKDKRLLLTMEEFQLVVLEELRDYENSVHSTLGMTPLEKLNRKISQGWKPRFFEHEIVNYILADRSIRKVERGRVTVGTVAFIGEDLRPADDGSMADVGLWKYDGRSVEVRFNRHDMTYAYATIEGSIRPLKAVTSVTMLDDEAMTEAISLKRRQMAAVRDAFAQLTKPIGGLTLKSEITPVIRKAEKVRNQLPETTDLNLAEEVTKQIACSTARSIPIKAIHTSPRDHYKWCQDMLISGNDLQPTDKAFMQNYEKSDEFQESTLYWKNYRKLGGHR